MSFLKGRGPPINFGDVESDKKELSPKEQLMAKYISKPPDNATGLISVSYRSEMINTPSSGLVVALRTLNERDH